MANPSGQLPENLAQAHAVSEAQREMLGKHPTKRGACRMLTFGSECYGLACIGIGDLFGLVLLRPW